MSLDAIAKGLADKVRDTGLPQMAMLSFGPDGGEQFGLAIVVTPTKPKALVTPIKLEVVQ